MMKHCNQTWTDLNGVQYPNGLPGNAFSIDFEWSCQSAGIASIAPLIGTAMNLETHELFFWLSDRLKGGTTTTLCRVGPRVRTLVAHNVPADRTKVWESTQIDDPIQWHDTMATHTLLAGPCSGQAFIMRRAANDEWKPYFMDFTALKNLLDVYNYWVAPEVPLKPESKAIRKIFYKGSMDDIRANFDELMEYALRDARLVAEIWEKQQQEFFSLDSIRGRAAALRANVSLSLSPDFESWVHNCEQKYADIKTRLNDLAATLIDEKCKEFQAEIRGSLREFELEEMPREWFLKSGTKLKKKWQDPVKQNLELNPQTQLVVKAWNLRYATKYWEPDSNGLPKWRTKVTPTFNLSVVQDLCELEYFGQKVTYCPIDKFCYIQPDGCKRKVFSPKKGPNTTDNCGSLFGADFVPLFEDGSLKSNNPIAQEIVHEATTISYWTSVRSRMSNLLLLSQLCGSQ